MKASLTRSGMGKHAKHMPLQCSQRTPVTAAVCLLIAAQASSAFGRDPLTPVQVQRALSLLAEYQDQFYGKTLEAELLVKESGIHAIGGGKTYAERVVVDTQGERIRWQTAGNLGNLQTGRFVGITRDYAWDGWIGTDLISTIDGRPKQAKIFCRRNWPPSAHTASWLLKPIGVDLFRSFSHAASDALGVSGTAHKGLPSYSSDVRRGGELRKWAQGQPAPLLPSRTSTDALRRFHARRNSSGEADGVDDAARD